MKRYKLKTTMDLLKNRSLWALLIGGTLLSATGCKKDDDEIATPATPSAAVFTTTDIGNNTIRVEGTAAANYTFTSDKKWLLQGFVYVEDGATLTIEPGTVIKGDKDSKGTLIIKRQGAKEGLFRSEGVFRFPVAGIGDFRTFLVVLEVFTGFKFD